MFYLIFLLFAAFSLKSMDIASIKPEIRDNIALEFTQTPHKLPEEAQNPSHPLYGLSECIDYQCKLSRSVNPHVRTIFAQKSVESIIQRHPQRDTLLTLGFVASGGLFTETQLLTYLINKGYKNLSLTFIDPSYKKDLSHPSLKALLNWLGSYSVQPQVHVYDSATEYLSQPHKATDLYAIDPYEGLSSVAIEQDLNAITQQLPEDGEITLLVKHNPEKLSDKNVAKIIKNRKKEGTLIETTELLSKVKA